MPTKLPMPNSCRIIFLLVSKDFFSQTNNINKTITDSNNRHQTSAASLSVMSLPKIAVKPANNTAMCNLINANRMWAKIRRLRFGATFHHFSDSSSAEFQYYCYQHKLMLWNPLSFSKIFGKVTVAHRYSKASTYL